MAFLVNEEQLLEASGEASIPRNPSLGGTAGRSRKDECK